MTGETIRDLLGPVIGKSGSISMIISTVLSWRRRWRQYGRGHSSR